MKKNGFSRLLAMLLVLAMVLPMVPVSAFAAVGDVVDGGMSLPTGGTGVSDTDTVSWPVKIYDYLNDGMLFEYAQAHDLSASENLSYGGGMPMPLTSGVIGNDYTAAETYTESAWGRWVSKDATNREANAEVDGTIVQAVDDVAPMYAHFKYIKSENATTYDPAKDEGTKFRAWISDFYTDNGKYYDKDELRYIVIVYRTNGVTDAASINFTFRDSSGDNYVGSDKTLAASTEWAYYVYDMYKDSATWNAIGNNIRYVQFMFPLNGIINGVAEEMDISHIAYFSSEEEAANFGKKAVVFNNDPGRYLVDGGMAKPDAGNGYVYDYTSSEAYNSALYGATQSLGNNNWIGSVQIAATVGTPMYLHVSEGSNDLDTAYIADFTSDFGGAPSKANVQYVTIVYRSSGITTGERTYGFWVETSTYPYAAGKGSRSNSYMKSFIPSSTWTYLTYDLSSIKTSDSDYSSVSTISKIGWYLPGLYSDETLDISHIGFFSSQNDADTFGKAAVAYDNNPGSIKTWNMGNNSAFAMLYSSAGGAWGKGTGTGGDPIATATSNGYFTYPIGLLQQPSDAWGDTTEALMISNHQKGVGSVENQIYLLYPDQPTGTEYDNESDFKMSTLNFDGYKLFGDVIQNGTTLFTAGLIEPTLETVTYTDGTTSRRIVYREETVDYIAKLLKNTLLIPRFDANGNPNYNYVRGTAHTQFGTVNGEAIDLATALRNQLGITFQEGKDKGTATAQMGTYAETEAKKNSLLGEFKACVSNIETFYDAAYYLLNNLFVKNSYNEEQDDYAYLQLNKVEGTEDTYVFDAGFTTSNNTSAVDYGEDQILNMVGAAGKDLFYFEANSKTTLYPFLPVTDANNNSSYPDMTWTPYFADDGVDSVINGKDSYNNRNFNYVMATNGEFQYYSDDELFFEFEGDDDIYLFLNGQLVLDIGGGHSIAKATFKVDDYVNWAWNIKNDAAQYAALSASEKARVDALALNDGDSCDFDFYYMERHGFGANCRIMTNIRVTDPAMNVTKSAYQEGVEVAEGGIISKDKPVEYGFAMTNLTDVELFQLSFVDETIGIELSYDNGLEVTGSNVCDVNGGTLEVTDLVAYVDGYDASGNKYDTITVTFANEEQLKKFLTNLTDPGSAGLMESGGGLWINSTVTIRGFAYTLTEAQKAAGRFDNLVKGTAYTDNGIPVKSEDEMRVFIAAEPMYYQWAGEDHVLNVKLDKLITDIKDAANTEGNSLQGTDGLAAITTSSVTSVVEVNAAGSVRDYPHVQVNSDKSLSIHYDTPGSYVFYLKITYSGKNATIPVLVNVADVVDSIFVLDYGLNAVLTEGNELHKNDTLTVPARQTDYALMGIGSTDPSYSPNNISFTKAEENTIGDSTVGSGYDGIFTLSDAALSYKPNDFMDQRDKIWLAVSVHETDFTNLVLGTTDINKEVQMYKSVTVLPATVVYYEDDFPAISYYTVNPDGVKPTDNVFEVIDGSGNNTGSNSLNQEVDQEQEYGQDAAYQSNTDMSGNSLHKITIRDAENFASFKFTGTGFELISWTVADNPAAVCVTVVDNKGETMKQIPVITEFDNNEDGTTAGGNEKIYQVPVIRVEDLDFGTYTVYINGYPTYDFDHPKTDGTYEVTPSYFYLDGIRIFQPLAKTENGITTPGVAEEYTDEENGAEIKEIREEIVDGSVAVAENNGETVTVSSALTTWTENLTGETYDGKEFEGNAVSTVNDYLTKGPNNEVYIDGNVSDTALIFYVKEDVAKQVHNLQIAVHAVDAGLFYVGSSAGAGETGMNAQIQYGVKIDEEFVWKELVTVTSGTEQYYTIPYSECPLTEKGYQVAIRVESGMASFTSLKINGLTLEKLSGDGTTTSLYYDNGILKDRATEAAVTMELFADYESISYQMRSTTVMGEPEETLPEETDPEETDPEETEPEEIDPEETDPEETDPEETEPEETEPEETEPEETDPEESTDPSDPEESTEPTTPETNPEEPDDGDSDEDGLYKLWKSLREAIELLKKLLGRG